MHPSLLTAVLLLASPAKSPPQTTCYTEMISTTWGTYENDDEAEDGIEKKKWDITMKPSKVCVTVYPDGKRSFSIEYQDNEGMSQRVESPPIPSVKAREPAQKRWEIRIGQTTRYRYGETMHGGMTIQGCKYKMEQKKFECAIATVPPRS